MFVYVHVYHDTCKHIHIYIHSCTCAQETPIHVCRMGFVGDIWPFFQAKFGWVHTFQHMSIINTRIYSIHMYAYVCLCVCVYICDLLSLDLRKHACVNTGHMHVNTGHKHACVNTGHKYACVNTGLPLATPVLCSIHTYIHTHVCVSVLCINVPVKTYDFVYLDHYNKIDLYTYGAACTYTYTRTRTRTHANTHTHTHNTHIHIHIAYIFVVLQEH